MKRLIITFGLILLTAASIIAQEKDSATLTGPYLGQEPPGMTPEIFAPGIVSTDLHEFSIAISPNGEEIFFTRSFANNHQRIMVSKLEDGKWTQPEPIPYSDEYPCFEPGFSPDGTKLYFNYWKPFDKSKPPSCDIWYIEKEGMDWGEPKHMDAPFNPGKAMYISIANSGTIYTTELANGFSEVYISRSIFKNSRYKNFERIGPPVSTGKNDMYPYIAPNESFLLFSSERLGKDMYYLFYTIPDDEGGWQEPILIDTGLDINVQPFLTFDQKYLFFTSKGDIYWVDARIIEKLKPDELK